MHTYLLLISTNTMLCKVKLMYENSPIPVIDLYPILTAKNQESALLHWTPLGSRDDCILWSSLGAVLDTDVDCITHIVRTLSYIIINIIINYE